MGGMGMSRESRKAWALSVGGKKQTAGQQGRQENRRQGCRARPELLEVESAAEARG